MENNKLNVELYQSQFLYEDIKEYEKGARCTFPDYECTSQCGFSEGVKLVRKI